RHCGRDPIAPGVLEPRRVPSRAIVAFPREMRGVNETRWRTLPLGRFGYLVLARSPPASFGRAEESGMAQDLYEVGRIPPEGTVPSRMYAQVIRPERFGEPDQAFQAEVIETPRAGPGEALVLVMAAGINY